MESCGQQQNVFMRLCAKRRPRTSADILYIYIAIFTMYERHEVQNTFTQMWRKKRWIKQHSYLTRVATLPSEYSLPTSGEKLTTTGKQLLHIHRTTHQAAIYTRLWATDCNKTDPVNGLNDTTAEPISTYSGMMACAYRRIGTGCCGTIRIWYNHYISRYIARRPHVQHTDNISTCIMRN